MFEEGVGDDVTLEEGEADVLQRKQTLLPPLSHIISSSSDEDGAPWSLTLHFIPVLVRSSTFSKISSETKDPSARSLHLHFTQMSPSYSTYSLRGDFRKKKQTI